MQIQDRKVRARSHQGALNYLRSLALIVALTSAQASAVTKVVAVGDPAPGAGTFAAVAGDSPFLLGANDRGDVLFWSGVADGVDVWGIFLFRDGTIVRIVAEGQIAPGVGGGTFVNLLSSTTNYRLNSRREVAFVSEVREGTSDSGVFRSPFPGSMVVKIAASGDRAPLPALVEPTDQPDIFVGSFASVDINERGDIFFSALQGKRVGKSFVSVGAIYLASPGYPIDRVLASGTRTEVGSLDLSPGSILGPFANIDQDFVVWATTESSQGVFRCHDGGCRKVVAVGDPIPGGTWPMAFGPCCVLGFNDLGQVGLQGLALRGEILVWSAGTFQSDIGPGYPVSQPDSTLESASVRSGDLRPINNVGQTAFSGRTVEGDPTAPGVFFFSGGTLTKRVSAGDPAPGLGSFTGFARTTVNNLGSIAFEANTTDPLGFYNSIWQGDSP